MDAYKFPHEVDAETEVKDEIEVEIVDDVPAGDRNREALPQEIVDELEKDDLTEYSDKVKKRLGQMKKVWHDERRAKESAIREQQEAVLFAQRVIEENKRLTTKQPQTEDEWTGWISRSEKIIDLHSRIADLEQEFEDLLKKAEAIQKNFEVLG